MTKSILTLGLALALGIPATFARSNQSGKQNEHTSGLRHPEYGDNILRLNPITALDVGVGPGLSYERIVSADKKVSIILPFSLLLNSDDDYYPYGNETHYTTYFYFTPGLKFYPFGQRTVTYAVGPNLMFGYGGGDTYSYTFDPGQGTTMYYPVTKHIFRLGILVNNYVNFQLTPAFNLGLTAGLGVRYIDHEKRIQNGYTRTFNHPMEITGQFSFSLGYRF